MKFSVLLAFLVAFSTLSAQTKYSTTDEKAIAGFHDARLLYEQRQYEKAQKALEKLKEKYPDFVEPYYLMANIYVEVNRVEKAIEEYRGSFTINPSFFPLGYYAVANMEMSLEHYENAKADFERFLSFERINPESKAKAERSLKNAAFAINAKKNPVPFNPKNMGTNINTEANEYFPGITSDNQMFLFTREVKDEKVQGGIHEDFFSSTNVNGDWGKAINLGTPINTYHNEGAPTLSPDGQTIILTACEIYGDYGTNRKGYGSCDLFYSRKQGDKWTAPRNMGAPISSAVWETQPSYSSDGKTLYFVRGVSRKKGSSDIWMTTLNEQGYWADPVKLSDKINTAGDELSVFIHPDNQTLYFSSDGHIGMGGQDIYLSRREPDGEWGEAVNLGFPINTFKNENSLLVGPDGTIAYFASDREGGFGGLDLYSFELDPKLRPQAVTYMKGKVFDAVTKTPLEARFELIDLETGKVVVESFSNPGNGEFLVSVPINRDYALNASRNGYLFYSENFSLKAKADAAKPTVKDVPLQPIREGEKVVLRNVFFNTASAELKKESKAELDKLVKFLQGNPTLKIQLSGHTDNVGDDKANQVLSDNRAKAVYNYLIENKIPAERLTYKGYGETTPIAANDTEEGRALNRRTEFEVVAK